MRVVLVLNEKSRRGQRDGALVRTTLAHCGIECFDDAAAPGIDAVIAAGGDGTVISTAGVALARGVPLGIVPLGTFNDLARTLGIPLGVSEACAVIGGGVTRAIDIGHVNGCYFVNEASIGLSTRVARLQTPEVKQRFGLLGVISTTLRAMRTARPFGVEIQYDGRCERFRTVQLTVANSEHFGGIIRRPDAAIDDGWLDLYSVEIDTWLQAVAVVRKILTRDPSSGEGLRTRRSTRFVVRTRRPHHVSADGEPAGMTPAAFEILPGALRVLIASKGTQDA